MSHPYGRAGSRGSGPRPPRQNPKTSASQTQKKHYGKPVSSKDPAQTASIFKTRAFKMLVDAVGAENLALGLDSNLTRIAELVDGERFTPETAFHMEMTLGLPDGFFDQPNPVLTPETIARLRSPLENKSSENAIDGSFEQPPSSIPAARIVHHTASEAVSAKDVDMPKKTSSTPVPATAKKGRATPPKHPSANAKPDEPKNVSRATKAAQQQSLELASTPSTAEIRRANLHILTARNGSKALLSRLLNLSQSNMAHRLHGKKRLDDAESKRFTDVLGLPAGWLDTPRQASDVPDAVTERLTPTSRRRASVTPGEVTRESASAAVTDDVDQIRALPEPENARVSDERVASGAESTVASAADLPDSSKQSSKVFSVADTRKRSSSTKDDSANEALASAVATDLGHLRGIAPIAEALLKTIAAKARTGLLNEAKALELLQQVALL